MSAEIVMGGDELGIYVILGVSARKLEGTPSGMTKQYGLYSTDDGAVQCALLIDSNTYSVMGFSAPAPDTPLRPHGLRVRRQVFVNSAGKELELPYPTPLAPYGFVGVTVRGDPTFVCVGQIDEIGTGESD